MVHQRSLLTYSEQRKHLKEVLNSYTTKFKEILGYFDDLDRARDMISKLRKENEMLRLQTFDIKTTFAKSDKPGVGISEHDDNEAILEKRLIQDNTIPLHDLITFLKERLKFKQHVIQSLKKMAESIDNEIARIKAHTPNLETAVASNRAVAKAKEMIAAFYTHLIKEKASDEQEARDIEARIARTKEVCEALEQQLAAKRKSLVQARDNFQRICIKRDKLVNKYREEVVQTVSAHTSLITDLTAKATALNNHWMGIRRLITVCATELKTHLLQFTRCPSCFAFLLNPYILWPCGHVLCYNCVMRGHEEYEPGSAEALAAIEAIRVAKAVRKQKNDEQSALKSSKLGPSETGDEGEIETPRRLVCMECRNALKMARDALGDEIQSRDERDRQLELALSKSEDPSAQPTGALSSSQSAQTLTKAALKELTVFQNPLIKPIENYNGHHFAARHRTLGRICLILRQYAVELGEVAERFEQRSRRQDQSIQSLFHTHDEILRALCQLDSIGEGNPFVSLRRPLSSKSKLVSKPSPRATPIPITVEALADEADSVNDSVLAQVESQLEVTSTPKLTDAELSESAAALAKTHRRSSISHDTELLTREITRIATMASSSSSPRNLDQLANSNQNGPLSGPDVSILRQPSAPATEASFASQGAPTPRNGPPSLATKLEASDATYSELQAMLQDD